MAEEIEAGTAGVSNELKSMIPPSQPKSASVTSTVTEKSMITKVLAFSTAVLSAVVVCLSIALARLSLRSGDTITNSSTIPIVQEVPTIPTKNPVPGVNICAGTKVSLPNIPCVIDELEQEVNTTAFALGTAEQSGVNVTLGYQGLYDTNAEPITEPFWEAGLCPVNVHWHLGTEHYSVGQYDEYGDSPAFHAADYDANYNRALAGDVRAGFKCHYFDETDSRFTTEYEWKHCVNTHVGETYEVHWPHSNMGDCGTPNQYQEPFYDGVFCRFATDYLGSLDFAKIGVQGQIFSIINDEAYYYPDLMRGMIVDGEMGMDMAKYTGSTTGTTRDNEICSQYTGITWQVDRKCHLISASSFDKMCADMKAQRDDMSGDLYPHGARELVADHLAADNQQRRALLRGI